MERATQAREDYLEAILVLGGDKKSIQSIEISNLLNVSKPAVSRAMKELLALDFIQKESYGAISLTPKGLEVAKDTYDRHLLIKKFLIKLGVSENISEHDCCLIEHVVSEETMQKIREFNNK